MAKGTYVKFWGNSSLVLGKAKLVFQQNKTCSVPKKSKTYAILNILRFQNNGTCGEEGKEEVEEEAVSDKLQSWTKLVETKAISARISQFPCVETPTRSQKYFLSPLPSINVVWNRTEDSSGEFWWQSNIVKGGGG